MLGFVLRNLAILAATAALLSACLGGSIPTPQMVERSRQAMPRCEAGDAEQCSVACKYGGPNRACSRACDAQDAAACLRLASRLEKEIDAQDAESAPTPIPPTDQESITALYERACQRGVGEGCRGAGGRILNGQGRGRHDGGRAVDLLKTGCQRYRDAESCCMMAQLNFRLAESKMPAETDTDFKAEGRRWVKYAERAGGDCPEPP
jgi:hypothetical protein